MGDDSRCACGARATVTEVMNEAGDVIGLEYMPGKQHAMCEPCARAKHGL